MPELRVPAYYETPNLPAYSKSLPRIPESAADARRVVRIALGLWSMTQLIDTATLAVTELVSNAAHHACGDTIRVTVTRTGSGRVRVAVIDMSHTHPRPRPVTSDGERGRGLPIISATTDGWGVDPLPWGKRVWTVLDADTP